MDQVVSTIETLSLNLDALYEKASGNQKVIDMLDTFENWFEKNLSTNDINKLTKDTIFVAHNVGFDYRVIKKEFSRIGMEFQRKLLCTIELTKIVYPELKSYSLGKIASNLNIKIKNRHRADGDAMATLILFNKLRDRLGEQNLSKFVKSLE